MKKQAGFSIVAAIGLSAALMASVLVIMSMQRSIDNETKFTAVKHARYIAEDILKTQVAIATQQAANRTSVVNFVNSIRDVDNGLKIPVPGTDCGNNTQCSLVVLSSTPTVIPQNSQVATTVEIVVGIPSAQMEKMKFKVEPITVKLKILTDKQIKDQNKESKGLYACDAGAPIFKGLKKVGQKLVADCAAVPTSSMITTEFKKVGTLDVLCSMSQGYWMKSVQSNLVPTCVDFIEEERVPASVEVCSGADQYPEAYTLDRKFNVVARACLNKGNPYDFSSNSN